MRYGLIIFLVLTIALAGADNGFGAEPLEGSLTISGAWAIYPTVVAWAEAFQKIHLNVKIDISAGGAGKGAADAIAGLVDIGMVSRDPDASELQKGIKAIYILKDAIFPLVSRNNFFREELLRKGMTKKDFIDLYIDGTVTQWNQLVPARIPERKPKPVHVYTRSDASGAAAGWAAFLGKKQEDLRGIGIYGDPALLEAAMRDPVGIGYNNFSFVFTREGLLLPGISLIPIDANENGKADPGEIYENRQQAIAAIEAGAYPATRKNFFFVHHPAAPLAQAFIHFALSEEGTKIVNAVGASLPISPQDRENILKTLE